MNYAFVVLPVSLFLLPTAASCRELSAEDYFRSAIGMYKTAKYENCLVFLSKHRKAISSIDAANTLENLCKEWKDRTEAGTTKMDDSTIMHKEAQIKKLVQANRTCASENDCTIVTPLACGSSKFYHWVTSIKNEHVSQIQLLADSLWKGASWKKGTFFTCEAKSNPVYCINKTCTD